MKKLIVSIITLVFILSSSYVMAETPYHSLNENDYSQVIQALEKPEWLKEYCNQNFLYEYNWVQHKDKIKKRNEENHDFWNKDWTIGPEQMFWEKKGDCDNQAAFILATLNHHNYNAKNYGVINNYTGVAHAVIVFYDKNNNRPLAMESAYSTILDGRKYEEIIKEGIYAFEIKNKIDENSYQPRNKNFKKSARLKLHEHLLECGDGLEVFIPNPFDNSLPNKVAIGWLEKNKIFKNKNFSPKKIGISISEHGYYSDFSNANKMVSLHFVWPKVGVTVYKGESNLKGIDLDFLVMDKLRVKSFICCRNFGEVFDSKINIVLNKSLSLMIKKNDKECNYFFESVVKNHEVQINDNSISLDLFDPENKKRRINLSFSYKNKKTTGALRLSGF